MADEPDREDQRADQRHVGLHRAGEGEAGRDAENGARQHAADEKVARRQRKLALAGLEHGDRDVGRFHVIRCPSSVSCDGRCRSRAPRSAARCRGSARTL